MTIIERPTPHQRACRIAESTARAIFDTAAELFKANSTGAAYAALDFAAHALMAADTLKQVDAPDFDAALFQVNAWLERAGRKVEELKAQAAN